MELGKYYNMAKISILPSRQDGFGLVLSQAMACGLPIVCTKDTGGEDLKQFLSDDKWIVVIEKTNAAELKAGILKALELYDELPEGYDYMKESRSELSWRGYGKRYADFLDNIYWGEKHRGMRQMYDRRKVRINILSAGRFHVLDLARELRTEGFDVKFYSYVPKPRCEKFGLQSTCCASYFWIAAPWILLDKGIRHVFPRIRVFSDIRKILMDHFVGLCMRDCDILIAMSGEFVYSLKCAKRREQL